MYPTLHIIMMALYIIAPLAALAWAVIRARTQRQSKPIASFLLMVFTALLLAWGMNYIYASNTGASVSPAQVLLMGYLFIALLTFLSALRKSTVWIVYRAWPAPAAPNPGPNARSKSVPPSTPLARVKSNLSYRKLTAGLLGILVLLALGAPLLMAALMTYRPKVIVTDDPAAKFGPDFDHVQFAATDDTPLDAYFIPATKYAGPGVAPPAWGQTTVILCHGLAANKTNQLEMAILLPSAGYNILSFDFRAHGSSAGQWCSFGNLERRDVLGAVRWLKTRRPTQSVHIVGLGASMGGAALIAAAADPGEWGSKIEAVATYAAFADLGQMADSLVAANYPEPLSWLVSHLAVPLAGIDTGADLRSFRPIALISKISPRPVMIIHGQQDQVVPFTQGQALYAAARIPRHWIPLQGDHVGILADQPAAQAVLTFFNSALAHRNELSFP